MADSNSDGSSSSSAVAGFGFLLDESPDSVVILQDGVYRHVNRTFHRTFGYTREDVEGGLSFFELVRKEDLEGVRHRYERRLEGDELPRTFRLDLITKSGATVPCETSASLIEFEGRPADLVFIRDVSERKSAEEALVRERSFQAQIMKTIGALVVVLDPEGRITLFNRSCERVTGYSFEEVKGEKVWDRLLDSEETEPVKQVFENLKAGRFPNQFENYWICKSGARRLIAWSNTAIVGELGDVEHIVGTGIDITERRRADEERLKLEAKMRQAQKLESLGVLAGGIAHDFNNLLTGILGNAGLALLDTAAGAPTRQNLLDIEAAAKRAADLARQMLAYSGRGNFVTGELDLRALVDETAHLLEASISKKTSLRFEFAPDVPPVEADATGLGQIVMNLVVNASEALGEENGVVKVRTGVMDCTEEYLRDIYLEEDLAEGRYCYFEVSDTGCGMDPETLGKIFDPFFSTKFAGRGLGLAAVMGIVRSHSGGIRVVSEPGKGTTVRVLLPAKTGSASGGADGDGRREQSGLQGKTVLLVDDEETVRRVGASMLDRLGCQVETAPDGRTAIEIFAENPSRFDCVILDLTMPRMGGEECFERLREIRDDVVVVLSSGYSEQELANRVAGRGMAGFLQKPYLYEVFTATLMKACG